MAHEGPLSGTTIIEMAGLGPGPFGVTMLADAGARVVRIERPSGSTLAGTLTAEKDPLARGRVCLRLDLKRPAGTDVLLNLIKSADALVEGYRPGVMEKLGLGPEVCMAQRPSLVYARMTGWGQSGPLAKTAGHDINYIALSGALHAIGAEGAPAVPLNLIGDFGGGGTLLAFGVASALFAAQRDGRGQVVDATMSDGAALLMAPFFARLRHGDWQDSRTSNLLDGGAPFYRTYRCSDGKFIAIGPLEDAFYTILLKFLRVEDEPLFAKRNDRTQWPAIGQRLEEIFSKRTRSEWCALMEDSDACLSPVLSLSEAPLHAHHVARKTFQTMAGADIPGPSPRFSTSDNRPCLPARGDAQTAIALLRAIGLNDEDIERLRSDRVVDI